MTIAVLVTEASDTYGARVRDTATGAIDHGASDAVTAEVNERAFEVASRSPVRIPMGEDGPNARRERFLNDALQFWRGQLALPVTTDNIAEGASAVKKRHDPNWKRRR